jgi:hypothetical protein
MADKSSEKPEVGEASKTAALLEKLTQLLLQHSSPNMTPTEGSAPPISVKLYGANYSL